jgi:hypothetical protein
MPADPKAAARGAYVSTALVTALLALATYKVKPLWGKVLLGGVALAGVPRLVRGPADLEARIIMRRNKRAMVQANIPGTQAPEPAPVITPGATAGYGSPFAAAVI